MNHIDNYTVQTVQFPHHGTPKTPTPTIDLILTAAERVALRDGVLRLTVEAVAREAKLSKGGAVSFRYERKPDSGDARSSHPVL